MKKIIIFIILAFILVSSIELLQNDNMDNIEITATVYPISFITEILYGSHSTINNIYPNDTNFNDYILSDKQIADFSKSTLFIFNGLGTEQEYAIKMVTENKNLLIIDASLGMELNKAVEETWFNPNNYLMLANNIKSGLNEYIVNPVLLDEINTNYNNLKVEISELEASFYEAAEEAPSKIIVTNHIMFEFLEKYGFEIYTLDNTVKESDKIVTDVETLIQNNEIKTIFIKDDSDINFNITNLIEDTEITLTQINSVSTITKYELDNNENYFTIMRNNLNLIKNSLYN